MNVVAVAEASAPAMFVMHFCPLTTVWPTLPPNLNLNFA